MDQLKEWWVSKQNEFCAIEKEDAENDDWCLVTQGVNRKEDSNRVRSLSPSFELVNEGELYNEQSNNRVNISSKSLLGDDFDKLYDVVEAKTYEEELPYIDDDPSLWLDEHNKPFKAEKKPEAVIPKARRNKRNELEILAAEFEEHDDVKERTIQEDIERKFLPYEFWDSIPARNSHNKKHDPFSKKRYRKWKKLPFSKNKNMQKKFQYS